MAVNLTVTPGFAVDSSGPTRRVEQSASSGFISGVDPMPGPRITRHQPDRQDGGGERSKDRGNGGCRQFEGSSRKDFGSERISEWCTRISGAERTQSFDGTLLLPVQPAHAAPGVPASQGAVNGLIVRISHCSPSAVMASNPA